MSRTKTEINPKRAENVKKLIEAEKITQTELADRIHMTQQNISRIVQMKQPLTEETARLIIEAFPDYRIEWFLGYDDIMTNYKRKEEGMEVHKIEDGLPPLGFPLIVRIQQDWEPKAKVLSPVYYLKSHYDGSFGFYHHGIGDEDYRIGPKSVEVTHWMFYPTADVMESECSCE